MPFRILSLDGGGIKGTFAASVLAELERMTGKRLVEHFDLITGTSTGGIIALGLGLELSAADLLKFYSENGPTVFPCTGANRKLGFIGRIFSPRRPQTALKATLTKVFAEKRFGESSCRLVIPSYDCVSGSIHLFKTAHHDQYKQDYLESAVDVAMATSAAPTYFPAHTRKNGGAFIDGGIWANCPVMVGVIEATSILKADAQDVRVLSIGTTAEPFHVTEKQRRGSILSWGVNIIDLFMQAQMNAALGQVRVVTGNDPYRISDIVRPGRFGLDDANAINDLTALGITQARRHEQEVSRLFLSAPCERFEPCVRVSGS